MKLTVVGCSGSFPSTESPCSSYLVEADGFRLLLDMGNGALGELQRHCGLYDLDAIALSHLHADHCIDMCGYFVARYYRHEGGRCAPLPVYGPPGTEQRLTTAYADTPSESSMSEVFTFRTLTPGGSFEAGPFRVRTERVEHPVEAYAFRVEHEESGRVLTYSGDTGPCPALELGGAGRRSVPVRGVVHGRQGADPGSPSERAGGRGGRGTGRRRAAGAHPCTAVDGSADQPAGCEGGLRRAGGDGPGRRGVRGLKKTGRRAAAAEAARHAGACHLVRSSTSSSGSRPGVLMSSFTIRKRKIT